MSKEHCYRVEVSCTNSSKDTFTVKDDPDDSGGYLDCEDGVCYVKASSFQEVEKLLGENIVKIEQIGVCYGE